MVTVQSSSVPEIVVRFLVLSVLADKGEDKQVARLQRRRGPGKERVAGGLAVAR